MIVVTFVDQRNFSSCFFLGFSFTEAVQVSGAFRYIPFPRVAVCAIKESLRGCLHELMFWEIG